MAARFDPLLARESTGYVVVLCPDRWFLDRIATYILAFEGNSKVTFFDGIVPRSGEGGTARTARPEQRVGG
jgi:hypothetical protein